MSTIIRIVCLFLVFFLHSHFSDVTWFALMGPEMEMQGFFMMVDCVKGFLYSRFLSTRRY